MAYADLGHDPWAYLDPDGSIRTPATCSHCGAQFDSLAECWEHIGHIDT